MFSKSSKLGLATAVAIALGGGLVPAHAGVIVHLFQWNYNDVANECETVLGPKGYAAVQINPPAEHLQGSSWWTVYQPINYRNFTAKGGNETELRSMITRCNAAGVKVYADAVFNQLASGSSTGTGGSSFDSSSFSYPYFGYNDFHHAGSITDYTNRDNVQNGALLGLPDLNTGSSYVQSELATYLNTLQSWGVAGFRIDAAKHMSVSDLSGILSLAGNPFVYSEVIGASGEPIQPSEYLGLGAVTEFAYGTNLATQFNGQINNLKTFGESWGLLSSDKAEVFVVNHDRERGHGGGGMLTYKDGSKYNLANVFMLAWPYGKYPQVMSGYDYGSDTDAGAPSVAVCTGSWNCDHRWSNIANMVSFHNVVEGTAMQNWQDIGTNQIAFGRGSKGFVVINNTSNSLTSTLQTGLPAGTYCNILAGDDLCSGSNIVVASDGTASFTVGGMQAAAIHVGAIPCDGDACVVERFSSLYFRGTSNSWVATPMTVDAETRIWSTTVTFDGAGDSDGAQRFKFDVTGDWSQNYGDTEADGVLDLNSTQDIYFTGVGTYKVSVDESDLSYSLTLVDDQQAPVAAVTPAAITVTQGDPVVFDASGSTDDGQIVSYSWSTGGTAATETVTFDTLGTFEVTVTVTDDDGMTDTATATVTVTDGSVVYDSNYDTMYFRGTPNSWGTQAMSLVADNLWEATVTFDGQTNQRFKFDVAGDWVTNFGDTDANGVAEQTGSDIYTSVVGEYKVQFNDETKAYSLTLVGEPVYTSTYDSMYFRGTPNSWAATAMTLVANNTWQTTITFDGTGDSSGSQRFKFDVAGDWATNFGDNNADYVADLTGSDITTDVVGTYVVTFNDSTKVYSLVAE
ncbi:alpha amylase C-terminal domain-containing protein [Pseudaeromonas sp. ZJS20]|uniref:alpha amylase C-terminal domain-containing protein n=1 Tax=Pseudaeromonas aegiceratis TaxID=3153928 RepID=UPI00390C76CC